MIETKQKQPSLCQSRAARDTKYAEPERGAVLLIAILVASVAFSVGLGIYNRTYKELLFASFWKQTQVAFAAADSGRECALYWDLHPATTATCFGTSFPWNAAAPVFPPGDIPVSGGCVNVAITKSAVYPFTTVAVRGYNTCDPADPRRVERGLSESY